MTLVVAMVIVIVMVLVMVMVMVMALVMLIMYVAGETCCSFSEIDRELDEP